MKAKTVLSSIFAGLALGVQAQAKTINADDRILVAYFSHSGNTREIAQQISQASGGALFEIVPANAYPEDYQDLTAVAKKEIQDGIKPELQANVEDIGKYDVIFIGSPCWWPLPEQWKALFFLRPWDRLELPMAASWCSPAFL